MSSTRTLEDGSIIFIRGEPPKMVPGFTRDPQNPKRFIPDFDDCHLRYTVDIPKYCPMQNTHYTIKQHRCRQLNREVTPRFCDDCNLPEKYASGDPDSGEEVRSG